jgi:hypothetical protein
MTSRSRAGEVLVEQSFQETMGESLHETLEATCDLRICGIGKPQVDKTAP